MVEVHPVIKNDADIYYHYKQGLPRAMADMCSAFVGSTDGSYIPFRKSSWHFSIPKEDACFVDGIFSPFLRWTARARIWLTTVEEEDLLPMAKRLDEVCEILQKDAHLVHELYGVDISDENVRQYYSPSVENGLQGLKHGFEEIYDQTPLCDEDGDFWAERDEWRDLHIHGKAEHCYDCCKGFLRYVDEGDRKENRELFNRAINGFIEISIMLNRARGFSDLKLRTMREAEQFQDSCRIDMTK